MREIDFVNLQGGRVGYTRPPRLDVILDYRHLGPRRVWMGGSKRRVWLISASSASSGSSGSVFQGPQYLTTLPSNMLKNGAGGTPFSEGQPFF